MNFLQHILLANSNMQNTNYIEELMNLRIDPHGSALGATGFLPWATGAKPWGSMADADWDHDGIPNYCDYYYGPGQFDPHKL